MALLLGKWITGRGHGGSRGGGGDGRKIGTLPG
jgi:hypothetical protein